MSQNLELIKHADLNRAYFCGGLTGLNKTLACILRGVRLKTFAVLQNAQGQIKLVSSNALAALQAARRRLKAAATDFFDSVSIARQPVRAARRVRSAHTARRPASSGSDDGDGPAHPAFHGLRRLSTQAFRIGGAA
jgi:hypothetical protein